MHVILQHCHFKAPLFHYRTLLVHDSSIGSSESLSDRHLRLKSSSKCLLIDFDTPQSPRNIHGLVVESFVDGIQNAVWRSEDIKCEFAEL